MLLAACGPAAKIRNAELKPQAKPRSIVASAYQQAHGAFVVQNNLLKGLFHPGLVWYRGGVGLQLLGVHHPLIVLKTCDRWT